MKSDDKFYITLLILGVVGIIAIVMCREKKSPTPLTPLPSGLGDNSFGTDIYVRKSDLDKYIYDMLQHRKYVSSLPSDVRSNSIYEGKEF